MAGDEYLAKAAEMQRRADRETHAGIRTELEKLARSYLVLAEQAERNALIEAPPAKAK